MRSITKCKDTHFLYMHKRFLNIFLLYVTANGETAFCNNSQKAVY